MPTSSRSRATRAASPLPAQSTTSTATIPTTTTTNTTSTDPLPSAAHIKRSSKTAAALPRADNRTSPEDFPIPRHTKRRKLEIRGPRQQTLDGYFARGDTLKPPVKLAAYAPHGPLIETVNGAQQLFTGHGDNGLATNGITEHDILPHNPVAKKQKRTKVQEMKQSDEKRTLRSQDDGPRLKSELATYFTNYEDIVFDVPHDEDLLTVDSILYFTDDASNRAKVDPPSPSKSAKSAKTSPVSVRRGYAPAEPHSQSSESNPSTKLQLDLARFSSGVRRDREDPLTDDTFLVSHKRAERKEKQMRNIEREHAMHEKAQLDRLLDGLLGHDWLRVLGITGVTESEAKKFESKRRYFIQEVQALVDKFKLWREEERRQRLEKEAALAAEREADLADDGPVDEDDVDGSGTGGDEVATEVSTSNPPSSDLNASASRQLQRETASAMQNLSADRKGKSKQSNKLSVTSTPTPIFDRPPSPITSFYPSRHLRDSALKKARNSRNQLAFGLPLPDVDEEYFSLPDGYLSEDVLRASARERRRRKREGNAKSNIPNSTAHPSTVI